MASDPSEYARHTPDDGYDEAYAHLGPETAVDRPIALADGGPVGEFGIGTGRLALPLPLREEA